jgi:hypothetical protein
MRLPISVATVLTVLAMAGCAASSSDEPASTTDETAAALTDSALGAGSRAKAKEILSDKLTAYYEGDGTTFGVVSEHGAPTLSATDDANVVHATGEFEDNELWGGAYLYRYDVNVDLTTKLIKQLKKPVMVKEIN